MAKKQQPRRSLTWRLAKWCGFSSPLVIVVAFAGRLLGIDTSWFLDAESEQGRALIQAISKAAKDRDGNREYDSPARVTRGDFIGPRAPMQPNPGFSGGSRYSDKSGYNGNDGPNRNFNSNLNAGRDDRRPPPPPAGITPPAPRTNGPEPRRTVDRRGDDNGFPSPNVRR